MWDPFVSILKNERPDLRILRYDSRGRSDVPQPGVIHLDILAADIQTLLDALRIPCLYALVGVSIGGATALKMALDNPNSITKMIVCDVNCCSPPNGAQP